MNRPSLREFLSKRKVKPNWDFCLVGDGSGQGSDKVVGWCCHLIAFGSDAVRTIEGCASGEGLGEPELVPYVHGLLALLQEGRPRRLVIVTDRADLVAIGSRKETPCGRTAPLWMIFWHLAEDIEVQWERVPSGEIDLNRAADRVAGECRRTLLGKVSAKGLLSA
jgi:hypothetical protein